MATLPDLHLRVSFVTSFPSASDHITVSAPAPRTVFEHSSEADAVQFVLALSCERRSHGAGSAVTGRNQLTTPSRLPRLHEILMRGPNASRMEVQPSYWAVMCAATAKPPAEDAPGVIVNNAQIGRAHV